MIAFLKREWAYLLSTFHDSETLIWARIQYLFASLLIAVNSIDLSPFITDRHLLVTYMLVNAFVTETLRKHREDWRDK